MNDKLRGLTRKINTMVILAELYNDAEGVRRDALEEAIRAIDQLRWRRVEEETPQTSGLYAITYSGCVGFSWWDENGWDEDDVEYWRPVTLPDEE